MASWRILLKSALVHWGNSIYELIVSSLPRSGYYGLVSSILASICGDVKTLLLETDRQSKKEVVRMVKRQAKRKLSSSLS